MNLSGESKVVLFLDAEGAWTEEWRGTFNDFLAENDLGSHYTARVWRDLEQVGFHTMGGGAAPTFKLVAMQWPTDKWPKAAIPGRTREEMAAADAASIIAPNAEAMRVELATRRPT